MTRKGEDHMFIDTHMHEMTCSKDSFLKLDQMVQIAEARGLGGICITDHDKIGRASCRERVRHGV